MSGFKSSPRILLLTPPMPTSPKYGFHLGDIRAPLGLGYIAGYLRSCGFQPSICDIYAGDKLPSLGGVEAIGIQVNSACYEEASILAREIRSQGFKGKLIAGGAHPTILPDTLLRYFDHVVRGEGEYVLRGILDESLRDRVIVAGRIENLDDLPRVPYELFSAPKYNRTIEECPSVKNVYTYSSSRGCPNRCEFCSTRGIYGRRWTYHSVERVLDDIGYLISDHNSKGIYFREDNFTASKQRLVSFCEEVLSRGLEFSWKCESRVDLTNNQISLMKRAGCVSLYVGIETGSPKLLKRYKKDITVDQIHRFVRTCKSEGIKVYGSFLTETPYEEEEDRIATNTLISQLKLDRVNVSKYIAMPGSVLYEEIIRNPSLADRYDTQVIR